MEPAERTSRQNWDITSIAETPRPAYTTGLTMVLNHPELLVVELPCEEASGRIEAAVAKIGRRHPILVPGKTYVATGGPFRVRELDAAILRGIFGSSVGTEVPFLQVLWPDERGLFPGEPGCDPQADSRQDLSRWRDLAADNAQS